MTESPIRRLSAQMPCWVPYVLLCLPLLIGQWSWGHPGHGEPQTQSGVESWAENLLGRHPNLISAEDREIIRLLMLADDPVQDNWSSVLIDALQDVDGVIEVRAEPGDGSDHFARKSISLPGDQGGFAVRMVRGEGPVTFEVAEFDFAWSEKHLSVPAAASGTTLVLVSLQNVPDGTTTLYLSLESPGSDVHLPIDIRVPAMGRFILEVTDDETGMPCPAMVQLKALGDGRLRAPANAIDLTEQFDSQAKTRERVRGAIPTDLPGIPSGDHWIMPGPVDMALPQGLWQVSVHRGMEYLNVVETVEIVTGGSARLAIQPRRWVDMAARGWYSGDDHVHARVMSESDSFRLRTWATAEDVRVVNILEMGDHERTYFQQREFAAQPGRRGHGYLVAGQEDPRVSYLGHTIALNISAPVRDVSRYLLHDWIYDRVQEAGGLYGYAHVGGGLFSIHRDLSLNMPREKCDFVELLQFHNMDTGLYYEFLDLGFRVTASAGSDVPWGGTMGEVRVYAYVDESGPAASSWFEALRQGRTFVTNGPMMDFRAGGALPGSIVHLDSGATTLSVTAETWGHPDRFVPTRLEIVMNGEVVHSAVHPGTDDAALEVDVEIDPGAGGWLAARAYGSNGTMAHTTPVYLHREGLRAWNHDRIPDLVDNRLADLDELRILVATLGEGDSATLEDVRSGALVGQWYGNADLTSARDVDIFNLPGMTWGPSSGRGGEWSAQWKGKLTLPEGMAEAITLHMEAGGAASLSIDGRMVLELKNAGETRCSIDRVSGQPLDIHLTYASIREPNSFLKLAWSDDSSPPQPLPKGWFTYGEDDLAAFRTSGHELDEIHLEVQSAELLARIETARSFYQDLLRLWEKEKTVRDR